MYSRAEPCPPCPSAARRVPEVTKPLVPMVTCPQLPRPGTAPALPPLPPEEPPAGRAGIRTPGNSLPSVPSAQGMLRARLEGTRPGTARSCPLPVTGTSPSSPEDAPTPPHPPSVPTAGRRGSTEPPPATAASTPPSPGGPQEGPHLHTPPWAQPTPPRNHRAQPTPHCPHCPPPAPTIPGTPSSHGLCPFSRLPDNSWIQEFTEMSQPRSDQGAGFVFTPQPLAPAGTVPPGTPGCLISSRALLPRDPAKGSWFKHPKPTTLTLISTPALKISSCHQRVAPWMRRRRCW